MIRSTRHIAFSLLTAALLSTTALAQDAAPSAGSNGKQANGQDAASQEGSGQDLPYDLRDVGLDEKISDSIPLDAVFLDENGQKVRIGDYFDGERPVIINFVYHSCPMLCSLVLEGLTETLGELDWLPGEEFEVLTISFGVEDTPEIAAESRSRHLEMLGREGAGDGWHYLTGTEENILKVTDATGYRFKWVEETQDYAHPAALIFADGEGKIARYIHGMTYLPKDVRKALVETSQGKVGSTVDQVLLYCYRYDPNSNSYVIHARNMMRIAGLLTVLVMGLGLFLFWRREKRSQDSATSKRVSNSLTTETT